MPRSKRDSTGGKSEGSQLLQSLDGKVQDIIEAVRHSAVVQAIESADATPLLIRSVVRNILLDVYHYGPAVTEAAATAIARMSDRPHLIPSLMQQVLDEASHPMMARDGYLALGGRLSSLASARPSAASFAVAAVVQRLATGPEPVCCVGFMYLLEATTAPIAAHFRKLMQRHTIQSEFVNQHAAEDVLHAERMGRQIVTIVTECPEAASFIEYGFDCLASVYPHPVWALAFARAQCEIEGGDA